MIENSQVVDKEGCKVRRSEKQKPYKRLVIKGKIHT